MAAAIGVAALATGLVSGPNAAAQGAAKAGSGGWKVCNQTSYVLEAAAAHYVGQGVSVEGWTRLRPGTCETALKGPLEPGIHYLYARSSSAHRGGQKVWGGDHPYCVDPTGSFSVESPQDCTSMGLESRKFKPVLIEKASGWTTNLTEIEDWDLEQAANAGLQRLLGESGVFSGKIDGFVGRKTRAAIAAFYKANGLPAETTDTELLDMLEQIAREKTMAVGMTLCNRTRGRVWAAIARRKGEGWESRGWWQLESGGCARAVDEGLLATEHFVFAELEEEDGTLRRLKGATDPFCIARARFAITGRKNCEASAYRTVDFKATAPARDKRLTVEFFERDFS